MKYVGWITILLSVLLCLVFKFYVVEIAYTKLPDGNYGELYGPVSYCKNYVYLLLAIMFVAGTGFLLPWRELKKKSGE